MLFTKLQAYSINLQAPFFRPFTKATTASILVLGVVTQSVFAKCSEPCLKIEDKLNVRLKSREAMGIAKKKNEQYLKDHPDASSSIQIKVRSNVMIATVRLETIENEISAFSQEFKKGCAECPALPKKEN